MRNIQLIIISFLYLCLGVSPASALPGRDLRLRRDDPPASSGDAPPPSSILESNSRFPSLSTSTVISQPPSSSNAPASQTGGPLASNSTALSASASASSTASAAAAAGVASDGEPLPIEPQLTAAMAVAGVILLASGAIYTFVGIKSRKVQVFLSTAYLISLATTVLIVYVMSPPVSAGIQGAYLAAVVIPGLILGGGAVVFKDVTEGLGCAVGGFALGMWFMTLKDGGLLSSQAGKIVLLCCFTAVGFSFSFSRYTRTYALIGATAFAGATALVLGIDCFSKTGLKEFWLYIWGLNNNLFPLGTKTYPLTKNLKAEVAGIPIAAFFGILSQIKVWQIVQKKREERAEVQNRKEREREDEEARLGKNLEARNQAEKMIWERTYSDAPRDLHSDSGIGSEASEKGGSDKGSARNSVSERGKAMENVKVVDMETDTDEVASVRNNKAARRLTPHIIVSVAEEEEGSMTPTSPGAVSPKLPAFDFQAEDDDDPTSSKSPQVNEVEIDPSLIESLKTKSLKPKTAPTPVVVPLPFRVPNGPPSPRDDQDDASSVATAATSIKRASKRFSTGSLFEKMTKGRLSHHAREASDATSVQAVADSPTRDTFDLAAMPASGKVSFDDTRVQNDATSNSKPSPPLSPSGSTRKSLSSPRTDYFNVQPDSKRDSGLLSPSLSVHSPGERNSSSNIQTEKETETEVAQVPASSVANAMPTSPILNLDSIKANTSGTSKVMHQFRTNEWAKHLEGAQEPEEDDIATWEPASPTYPPPAETEHPASESTNEAAAPAAPRTEASSSETAPTSPVMAPADDQYPKASWPKRNSRRQSSEPKPVAVVTRQASREGRSGSRMSALRSNSGSRTRGGKARQITQQALVTSPIQEDVEAFFPPAQRRRRSSLQADTLLAQREAMASQSSIVRSASQASQYASYNASRNSLAQQSDSTLSRRSSNPEQFNLPRQPSAASLRNSTQPYSPPPPIRNYSPMQVAQPITHTSPTPPPDRPLHFKSHAPDDVRRSQMLSQWRTSLAGDATQRRASQMNDFDAQASQMGQSWMEAQRQQREYERFRQQSVGWGTETAMSPRAAAVAVAPAPAGHRLSQAAAAHDAHREVLRRMQSKSKV